ncbi:MAG: hypothetical protein A3J87_04995 [Sideroxydans sp. RIFOXYB12_FULL_59_6]|nr:MAG: hypothetical protein A3J87_04995 [Sideroxydans sp. RIFOXYB12_FULL_59_6]
MTYALSTRLLRRPPQDARISYWHHWQVFLRALQGMAWGSAAVFFHVAGQAGLITDLTVLTVLAAIAATSTVNMAPSYQTLSAFVVSVLSVPLLYYFWLGDARHVQFAIGLLVMMGIVLRVGYDGYRQFVDGVSKLVLNQAISQQLEQRNRQLAETARQLHTLAMHDELTGIYNRRHIVDLLERQRQLFNRHGTPCSLALFDIDHFKQVNDRHGHAAGDEVLIAFVQRIQSLLRMEDAFGRYGGEEFLLVLPQTHASDALLLAERIRLQVADTPLVMLPQPLQVTLSCGIAELQGQENVDVWLNRADTALYRAKAAGRDRVLLAGT